MVPKNDIRQPLQPITLEDIVLREFRDSDAEEFAKATRESVDTVGPWMPWCSSSFSAQDALDWFEQCRTSLDTNSGYEFGIFAEDSGKLLGGAGLNSINYQHYFCNLGYWVRQSAQRHGVALRAARALLPYAFNSLGMQRVEIVIAAGNTASEGVARKAGARFEGIARNRLYLHGEAVSASIFSIVP
jgi:RimJ/RimL family protein N-acetyltransferase